MNPACALGERRFAVRRAARGWRRAGLIDEPTLGRVAQEFADDRERVGNAVRVLLFVFAWIAVQSAAGFVGMFLAGRGLGVLSLLFGVLSAGATELLRNQLRRARGGAEEATALMALGGALGGVAWFLFDGLPDADAFPLFFVAGAALSLAAAWRWGGAVFGALAASGLFLALLRFGSARWAWVALAAILAAPLVKLAESERLAPSQRRAAWAALAVALGAAYTAVHLGLWDLTAFEKLSGFADGSTSAKTMPRFVAVSGTALLPLALLAFGLATHRRLLLDLGLLGGVATTITALAYWDPRPIWLVLVVAGALLIGLALLARFLLDRAPARELGGWTAEPLYEHPDRQSLVEIAASLAAFSPAAHQRPAEPTPEFQGRGGELGGGGASGSF